MGGRRGRAREFTWIALFAILGAFSSSSSSSRKRSSKGSGRVLTLEQLRELARSVGFPAEQLDTAAAIATAESGGDPCARGDPHNPPSCDDPGSSTSFGLWQIHIPAHPEFTFAELVQPLENARAAFKVWVNAGYSWHPWSTYSPGPGGAPAAYLAWMPGGKYGPAEGAS